MGEGTVPSTVISPQHTAPGYMKTVIEVGRRRFGKVYSVPRTPLAPKNSTNPKLWLLRAITHKSYDGSTFSTTMSTLPAWSLPCSIVILILTPVKSVSNEVVGCGDLIVEQYESLHKSEHARRVASSGFFVSTSLASARGNSELIGIAEATRINNNKNKESVLERSILPLFMKQKD